jgi:exodeoxyribonuclease X
VTKYLMRAIDFETSRGPDDPENEVIEFGWTDLIFTPETREVIVDAAPNRLMFKAAKGITFDTMAIHHITPAMVEAEPICEDTHLRILANAENSALPGPPAFLFAHKADFERKFLTDEVAPGRRWICTYKAALRALPEAPRHNNQTLRYYLGLDLPEHLAMPPHRAAPDSFVTAHIMATLLRRGVRVADMTRWTFEPAWMPKCPLAKHKGKAWPDVPADYLDWILTKATDMDPDVKHWAKVEVDRRREALANPQPAPTEEGDDYV